MSFELIQAMTSNVQQLVLSFYSEMKEGLTLKLIPLNLSNVYRTKALYGVKKTIIGSPYTYK
jgi:hypothetical protein